MSTVEVAGLRATSKEGSELSTDMQLEMSTCRPFPLATAASREVITVKET